MESVGYFLLCRIQFTILIYKSTHLLPDANCSNSNLHFHVRKSLFKHSLPFFYFQLRNFEIRKNTVLKSIVFLFDLSVMQIVAVNCKGGKAISDNIRKYVRLDWCDSRWWRYQLNTNWWWQIVKIYEYEYDMIWGCLPCPFVVICCGFARVEVAF